MSQRNVWARVQKAICLATTSALMSDTIVKMDKASEWAKATLKAGPAKLQNQFADNVDWFDVESPSKSFDANQDKCRYYNVPVPDNARIALVERSTGHDFYHASRVPMRGDPDLRIIAAQGPLRNTVADFWHLIMQQRVGVVVQLCSYEDKHHNGYAHLDCARYWPSGEGAELSVDEFTVKTDKEELIDDKKGLQLRTLTVSQKKGDTTTHHTLHHIYVASWPDYGVPDTVDPIVAVLRWVETRPQTDTPLLAHCLAGIGRTCTLLASLIAVRALVRPEGVVKNPETLLQNTIQEIRASRPGAVQTSSQYIYAHACVLKRLAEMELILDDEELEKFPYMLHKDRKRKITTV